MGLIKGSPMLHGFLHLFVNGQLNLLLLASVSQHTADVVLHQHFANLVGACMHTHQGQEFLRDSVPIRALSRLSVSCGDHAADPRKSDWQRRAPVDREPRSRPRLP
jgi:hypothetical protein